MNNRLMVCCENRRKAEPYLEALMSMGISEENLRLVTPDEPHRELAGAAFTAAGVVLCGGPDLDPKWYGEQPRDDAELSIHPALDQMDWDLLEGSRAGRTPVWAICRGMQIFNVFQGGTLWQDLPSQFDGVLEHDPEGPDDAVAHPVFVVSRREGFGKLLDRGRTEVNSRHHQAVKSLGADLTAVAESPDGIVEVLSLDDAGWWVKGVQWHPENLMHLQEQRLLWAEFLRVAEDRAAQARHGQARRLVR